MTQFEIITLQLLCKILTRLIQMPGARGTLPDLQYITQTLDHIEASKK